MQNGKNKPQMNKLHSICIITCWYGEYPWYFPYFVKSCRYNPSIDFVIITDNNSTILDKPENIKIIQKTLNEFKTNATNRFDFDVVIDNPYKLCDFKPAYGFLFPEIIAPYTFWGHGDIDMVYGDIRSFLTDDILNYYDLISPREDITMGTFCLYRNNSIMNSLFFQSRDYKEVFTSPENFCFDECNFLFSELAFGNSILDYHNHIQSMTYLAVKGNEEGKFKVLFDRFIIQGMFNNIRWDHGKIIFNNKIECLFYDLIYYKTECKNKIAIFPVPDAYYFNRKRIRKINVLKRCILNIMIKIRELKER